MASLEHRGDDRWRVVVWDPVARRKRTRSFTADGARAAKRAAAHHVAELEGEIADALAARGTFRGLVAEWLRMRERDRSPSTVAEYRRLTDEMVARFGRMQLRDVTPKVVDDWYGDLLDRGVSRRGVQRRHEVLRNVLRFGVRRGQLREAATDRATVPEARPAATYTPTSAEVRAMFHALPDVPWGRAVALLAATGMRRGEVVGLRWDEVTATTVEVARSVIEVDGTTVCKEPKGRRARTVTLVDMARVILARQPHDEPWVFPSPSDASQPMRPNHLTLMWGRWRKRHGLERVRLHDLRHWFATEMIASGVPAPTVAAQLGHAQVSTTLNIYAAPTAEGLARGVAAINRALGGESSAP